MYAAEPGRDPSAAIARRAKQLFQESEQRLHRSHDRMFALLMVFQWIVGIVAAMWISPLAWAGQTSSVHVHAWAAILLGGAIVSFPIFLALAHPGRVLTRHAIACAQMLQAALLIHLTGGRIESHFQIFGLLAFLALYRDWRVLVTAVTVITCDHLIRGTLWPQSIYGVLTPSWWRWAEHGGWILFELTVLLRGIQQNRSEMVSIAQRSAELEATNASVEKIIAERTVQLTDEIVARKRQEEDLARTRDAALEGARLKAEFLANMSHEIRTPMNGIIGMTGLLLDTELGSEQREFVEIIRSCGDSLLTIINDILDFSKIEAGKLNFEILDFDLRSTVESVVDLLAERAQSKRLELVVLLDKNVPTALRGDAGRVRQILLNLLGNAIKFTDSGEVVIHAALKEQTEHDVLLHFSVRDTGIGISSDSCKALFKAFSQGDGSNTRKYGGTGLGLVISQRLVHLMEGDIGVQSTPGMGSTFWFTARFEKQSQVSAEAERSSADLRGAHVLVIDDNQTNRRVVRLQLKSWGIQSEEACNADDALTLLRRARDQQRPFDLALLDMQMPTVDGLELARRIHADPTLADTKLIVMTSLGIADRDAQLSAAGVSSYLTKPVKQSRLHAAVLSALAGRAGGSSRVATHAAPPVPQVASPPPPAEDPPRRSKLHAHILVAEDNPVNQKVLLRQLAKLGCRADAVGNGSEALAALARIPYDIVLMDCQMPEMDGYTAARELRRRQKEGTRVHIIALTAHTMQGDREKCLAAGMDDYLGKPVNLEALEQKLQDWAVQRQIEELEKTQPPEATAPLDMKMLAENGEQQPAVIRELMKLYLQYGSKQIEQLRQAVHSNAVGEVEIVAHSLMGASMNFGMHAMVKPLRQLEAIARAGHLTNANSYFDKVVHEFARIQSFLTTKSLCEPSAPTSLHENAASAR